jgi:hypothetical protein
MAFQASAENKAIFDRPFSALDRGSPYSYVRSACEAHLPNPLQIGRVHAQREWPSATWETATSRCSHSQSVENPRSRALYGWQEVISY